MPDSTSTGLLALLYNGTLLLSLALIYDLFVIPLFDRSTIWRRFLIGFGVSVLGVGVMLTPWHYAPGVVFDTRSVLLSISGLFFGAIPTLVAAVITSMFRIYQGGAGAMTGVIVIVGTSLVGIGWRLWRKPVLADLSWRELLLFGLIVHGVMIMLLLTLPQPLAREVFGTLWVPILVVYPVVTALLGKLITNRLRQSDVVRALQRSEARYRSYVDNAPYAVFVADETGRYQEVNLAACRLAGYTEAELLGTRVGALLPPDWQEEGLRHFQRVISDGYAYGEYPFLRKNGSQGWWSIAAVKLSPTRFLGYSADITAEREAKAARQQSEERFRHVAASISDIAYSCVDDGRKFRLEWMSGAVERITGYTVEEMIALGCWGHLVVDEDRPIFEQTILNIAVGDVRSCELRLRHRTGRIIWSEATGECVADSTGRRLYGAIVDISNRKAIAEALRHSEQTALALLNASDDAVFLLDTQFRVLVCNLELTHRVDRPESEIIGRSIFDLLPPNVAEQHKHYVERVLQTHKPVRFEDERNGAIIDSTAYPILDADGEVTQIAIFGRDVTAQRQAEERYSTLFREMLDGFALHEIICNERNEPVDYRFLAVNPAFERLTGLRVEDVVGRTVLDVLPQTEHYWIETYGRVAITREPVQIENFSQAFGRYFEVTAFSPAPRQFATIFVDVSVRKRAELDLRHRDALLEALSYVAGSFLEADDLEAVIPPALQRLGEAAVVSCVYLFQNEAAADGELLTTRRFEWCAPGVTPQLGNPVLQRGSSYRALGLARWIDVLAQGDIISGHAKDFPDSEQQLLAEEDVVSIMIVPVFVERRWWGFLGFERRDVEYVWSEAEIESLRAVSRSLGVTIENLASRSRIEQQADELVQIMNGVPEGLLLLDNAGNVISANPRAHQYLEWLTGDVKFERIKTLGDRALSSLLTSPTDRWGHLVKAGQRTFEVLAQLVEHAPAPASWVLVIRDITDDLFVQEQLRRQERLAAVGQLAAGIAHDFNNLMSVIILYAQMAAQSENISDSNRDRMRIIEEQGQRAAQMIRQILDFSRRTTIERHPLDLLPLFKEQIKLLQRTLSENITISLETPLTECFVLGDPTRLEQVIMNLAVNARDAMSDGGRLSIGIDLTEFAREKEAPLPDMKPGRWIRLSVSDNGAGIAPEHVEHIFEPFFSTKPVGVGTGLGLPQVHGIVGQHGGHITVESTIGVGTVFTIYLPVLAMLTPGAAGTPAVTHLANGNGETILVVEDEEALRRTLTEVLAQWNYHVVAVGNGQEALNVLDEGLQPDLIVSDVVMPEMSGLALFKALLQRKTDIPLIFLTGHLRGDELDSLRQYGLRAWLPKPPGIVQLAETITAVLQQRAGAPSAS